MFLVLAGLPVSQPTAAAEGEFVNLSTRGLVETGGEVIIGGFIIEGGGQQVLIQALGPELANRGVSNALADPVLTITASDGTILMVNDDWDDRQGQLVTELWGGSPPFTAGSKDSAVVLTLEPGAYTAKVEGKNGTVGVALVEVYDIDSPDNEGEFVNLSTRGLVKTGGEVMIGGFIIRDGARQALIQALGPELANRGVSNALADPVLTITASDGTILMVNDNWEDSQGQLVTELWGGSPPFTAGSKDSAVILTLEPGGYAAKVEGKNGTVGVALVEVYAIDSGGGLETAHGVGATLSDLPTGSWNPDVTSGGSVGSSGGNVTIELNDGGYIEEGSFRYTCQSSGGCAIENRSVTLGTIIQTAQGAAPGGGGTEPNTQPSFTAGSNPGNQSYTVGAAITTLTLPAASGGNGPLTYSLTPSVPGLSFNANTRRLTGAPTTADTHTMAYTVTDADGDTDSLTFNITVAEPDTQPSFTAGSNPGNQSYTLHTAITALTLPAASGGNGSLTYSLSRSVPGLNFNANTRRLTGAPTTTTAGFPMTYTVVDADGDTDSLTFNIFIDWYPRPSFSDFDKNLNNRYYAVDTAITARTLPAALGGTGSLTYSLTPSVPGLSFNANTRRLTGAPTTAGSYSMTYTVVDADGDADSLTFVIKVWAPVDGPTDDRAILVELYEATDGPNWVDNENWLTDAPLGEWYGVEVDSNGRVIGLELSGVLDSEGQRVNHGLTGQIPPSLGNLFELQTLDLHLNELSGPIPSEMGNLIKLKRLSIPNNNLSGAIPPELGNLSDLLFLTLANNELAGPVPTELANLTHLNSLSLGWNAGLCLPADSGLQAWMIERGQTLLPCPTDDGVRLLPRALMREDGNGLSLALPTDLQEASLSVSDSTVVDATIDGIWLRLAPRSPGTAEVTLTPSGGEGPAIAGVAVRAAIGQFGIDIVMDQPAPIGYEEAVTTAADWWSSVLAETEWPDRQTDCNHFEGKLEALADELVIWARSGDKIGGVGLAATCFRNVEGPVALTPGGGVYTVETAHAAGVGTALHEIGHILGLVLWPYEQVSQPGLVSDDGNYFVGTRAVDAFRAGGGDPALPGVPIQGPHWSREDVKGELMALGGDYIMNSISLAALADAGYNVDMTHSTPWLKNPPPAPVKSAAPPSFSDAQAPGDLTYTEGSPTAVFKLPAASGGDGTLTYSLSPNVPGLSFWSDRQWLLGTPTRAASYSMTYTVTDSYGGTDSLNFTITVNPLPGNTTAPNFIGSQSNLSYTVDTGITALTLPGASGGNGSLTYSLTPNVPGLTFTASNRRLTGTPTTADTHSMTYVVRDTDGDTDQLTFTITIAEADTTPSFTGSQSNLSYTVDTGITALTLPGASGGNGSLTYSLSPSVPGLTFTASNRRLTGTPTTADTHSMTYVVRDTDGDTDQLTFTITIAEADTTPSFTGSQSNLSYTVDTGITALTLPGASGGNGSLTYSLTPNVPGLTFTASNRRLTGTPTTADTHSMTYVVRDTDGDTDQLTFTITIAEADTTPSFTGSQSNLSYTVDTGITALTLPGASGGNGSLTYSLTPNVPGLTFTASNRRLTGTPTTADTHSMTYVVRDTDGDTDQLTFTITIAEADTTPSFTGSQSNLSYTVDTGITALTLPGASGGNGSLTYSLSPSVPGLTFTASNRRLTGTPTTADTHSMTYVVRDTDGDTDQLTFTITIAEADTTPSFTGSQSNLSYTVDTGITALTLPGASGGNGSLTYSLTPNVPGLTFTASNRRLTGTPTTADTHSMTYVVRDTDGDTDQLTFTITIAEADTTPSFTGSQSNLSYTVDTGITALTLPGASGGNGSLTYSLTPNVPGLTFTASNRRLTGTPTTADTHSMTYVVRDTDGDTDQLTFTITIAEADTTPSFTGSQSNLSYTVDTGITALTLPGASGGNGSLTYSLSPSVPGLTFTASNRRLTGTPTTADTHSMTYVVRDTDGDTDQLTFTITIAEADTTPSFTGSQSNLSYTVDTGITALTLPGASGGNGSLTYSLTPNVPGLTFTASNRRLTGTPTTADTHSMTYVVRDTDGDTDQLTFTITIAEADTTPSFTGSQSNLSYTVDTGITALTLPGASGGNGSLTYSLTPNVPGLTFTASNRRLTGTPTTADTHSMTYVVRDTDGDTDQLTFTITIAEADTTPSFTGSQSNLSYTVDTGITALTLPGASGGNGSLTYSLSPSVPGLTFTASNRRLTGTPTSPGAYSMTYTATDADNDTDTLSFTITIAEATSVNYTRMEALQVSPGRVQFSFFSAGGCVELEDSTINGIVVTTNSSKWQRRADSDSAWEDVPNTEEQGGLCSYSPTTAGEYRMVAVITLNGTRYNVSSWNTITVN